MATERLRYVNAASSGGDGTTNATSGANAAYASLSACEAAEDAAGSDLVSLDEFLHIMCEGATDDTTVVLLDGFITDATRYIEIEGNNGTGVWDDTKYALVIDTTKPLDINDPNVKLTKLQVRNTKASPVNTDSAVFIKKEDCIIDRCLFRGGRWTLRVGTTGTLKIMRTAAYGSPSGSSGGGLIDYALCTIEAQDCVFQGDVYGVRNLSSSTYTLRNCYAEGNSGFAYSGTIGKTTCASSDSTGSPGLKNVSYDATTFSNVTDGSEDFTVVIGSSLIDSGTDNSGQSAPFDYTEDAAGVTITTPQDVGSIQLGASASPVITTIVSDPAITGASITITGTDFEAAQGTGGVTQEQGTVIVGLTETAWADTSITVTSAVIELTGLKYGTNTLKVTADAGGSGTKTFVATPITDNEYVDLTSIAAVGDRITAISDLAVGDQIIYEALLQLLGVPTIYTVTVNDDATFSVDGSTPAGTYTFNVRAWDTADQTWGNAADQTVVITSQQGGGGGSGEAKKNRTINLSLSISL